MGTTSRLIEVLPRQMRDIALRIKRLRESSGLTQQELASGCNRVAGELLGSEDRNRVGRMSRSRIAHLEQARAQSPSKGAAITLQPHEVQLLAHVLGVSPEQLVGDHAGGIVTWDPLTNTQRGRHFLGLLDEYTRDAREILGWSEFLPCSLVTPEFMHAHHEAIFAADALHLPEAMREEFTRAAVTMYDTIGEKRRSEITATASLRPWSMTQLILRSDIESVALGRGAYASIETELRRDCLVNLRNLIADRSLRIDLFVAVDGAGMRRLFRGFDALVVCDETFAFWRHDSGDIACTLNPSIIRLRRAALAACRERALYRDTGEVTRFLDAMVRSMRPGAMVTGIDAPGKQRSPARPPR